MRAQKKPVEVEFVRYLGTPESRHVCEMFVGEDWVSSECGFKPVIRTLEGPMHVTTGDYIIKGVQGEFYPCKPDIFMETYYVIGE